MANFGEMANFESMPIFENMAIFAKNGKFGENERFWENGKFRKYGKFSNLKNISIFFFKKKISNPFMRDSYQRQNEDKKLGAVPLEFVNYHFL